MSSTDTTTTASSVVTIVEADVQAIITKIANGVEIVVADFNTAAQWVAQEIPTIVTYIEQIVTFANAVGAGSNHDVATAIAAANEAVEGLNAFASAENANTSSSTTATAQAIISAYTAVKTAQSQSAAAAAAATSNAIAAT